MKQAGVIAASVAAAVAGCSTSLATHSKNEYEKNGGSESRRCGGGEKEKFKPKFDGLRFIETLVTAHSHVTELLEQQEQSD